MDGIGRLLDMQEFPTTRAGHGELLGWRSGFGAVTRVGVEGTGSYRPGVARILRTVRVDVVEVDRPIHRHAPAPLIP
jgi:transposase